MSDKESTEFEVGKIDPRLTLGQLSETIGETIVEFLHKYDEVREVTLILTKDGIKFRFAKALDDAEFRDFIANHGYDPDRLYSSLFRED